MNTKPTNPDVQLTDGYLANKFSKPMSESEWRANLEQALKLKPSDFIVSNDVAAQYPTAQQSLTFNHASGVKKHLSPAMEKILGLDSESLKKMTLADLSKGNITLR